MVEIPEIYIKGESVMKVKNLEKEIDRCLDTLVSMGDRANILYDAYTKKASKKELKKFKKKMCKKYEKDFERVFDI